jgi:hypothetical protein
MSTGRTHKDLADNEFGGDSSRWGRGYNWMVKYVEVWARSIQKTTGNGPTRGTKPTVKCKMFEDNSAALMLANAPAMRPRTKHINVKYHFF